MDTQTKNIVIFPLPIQGPVNCMLKLAELILTLTQRTTITFLTTHFIHHHLHLHSSAPSRLTRFGPRFRFETVSDGLGSYENPREGHQLVGMTNHLGTQAQEAGGRVREILMGNGSDGRVTCVIADGFFWFMVDVAKEIGVALFYFETVSPCGLWTYLCVPHMVRAGDLPFPDGNLDELITSVPGMETYLRRRDLPSFCRDYDPNNPSVQLFLKEAEHYSRAQGHILNTFDDLEPELLSQMRPSSPNLYTVGPLHLNLVTRLGRESSKITNLPFSFSNSLWQEDRTCFTWLDSLPNRSVLFVSIGSLALMTKDQLVEFWHGLVDSETRFLWVRRPNSVIDCPDDDQLDLSEEILEATRERGCIVRWVPQEEVLAHRAIGGFLTHSGWNSTLESVIAGVPMICYPFFVDQQVNSRLVSEVWKIGLDMKDTCSRVVIQAMIKDLMGTRKDEFSRRAEDLAKLAAKAVGEGGSSYDNLNRLIEDIECMRFSKLGNAP
ncbi:hypothetical protein RND81_10G207700 [Saponaria officinalis]|uniref:Glycosyltransferase n=1 Tax=Saponaria officinalis TaxID=3572 RepID=A0AAW1I664_SAPOF